MKPLVFDALSPEATRRRLDAVELEEKSKLAEGLALIARMDARDDYLEAGYSCMQKYCMGRLGMSEEKTQRRIRVARLGRQFTQVFECIADGRLTVTNACELAPVLAPGNVDRLLDAAAHQPKLEVRRIVLALQDAVPSAAQMPTPSAAEHSAECTPQPSFADLCASASPDTVMTEAAPARVKSHVRGRVFETESGAHGVRVELTDAEFAEFTKVRDLLAHVVRNGDPAEVIARALSHYAAHLEKQRYGAKPASAELERTPTGRHIPKALRRHVAERDGHCCTFTSPDGHRCAETRALQFDHVTPLAQGGETIAENLRLLCAHHNRHEAAKKLTAERIAAERTSHLALGKIEDRVLAALKDRGKSIAA